MTAPLATPAPPSPFPPFAPFSALPFELVEEIIESAIPLRFHSSTYRARQNTLVSFCLVSRLFHQISKPLLFAVARLTSKNVFPWMLSHEEEEDSRKLLYELIIDFSWTGATSGRAALMSILHRHSQLSLLVIYSRKSEVDIAKLAQLEHLSILRLIHVDISASNFFTFPRLHELTVVYVGPTQSFSDRLNIGCFPSLRALCVYPYTASDLSERFIMRLLETFSDHLEIISLQESTVSSMPADLLRRIEHKTLVDRWSPRLAMSLCPLCLRFRAYGTLSLTLLLRNLSTLPSARLPSLLYLPSRLRQIANDEPRNGDDWKNFLELCFRRSIEIIFEEQSNGEIVDSQFSPDFWRRMKEEKRKASTE